MANIFLLGVKISRYDDGFLAPFILSPRENQWKEVNKEGRISEQKKEKPTPVLASL
jgi:hypothetical protein